MHITRVGQKFTNAIEENTHVIAEEFSHMGVDEDREHLTIKTYVDPFQEGGKQYFYTVHLNAEDLTELLGAAAKFMGRPYRDEDKLAKQFQRSSKLLANLERFKMLVLGFVGHKATQEYIADEIENANE